MQSSKKIEQLIDEAKKAASIRENKYITSEHVLYVMLLDDDFVITLKKFGIQIDSLIKEIQEYLDKKA